MKRLMAVWMFGVISAMAAEPKPDMLGAIVYSLCGERIALMFVEANRNKVNVFTIALRKLPQDRVDKYMAEIAAARAGGSRVDDIELDASCIKT